MTPITDADGWEYSQDKYADWRGIHEARGLRTRLKRRLEAAQQDVRDGRLQRREGGVWVDRIDGGRAWN